MPPDADKLRARNNGANAAVVNKDEMVPTGSERIVGSLDQLKSHEVCIDGVIYDISDFDHPGGGQIFVFGGNDVSVQYRMIHPHHASDGIDRHLEKMKRVGKVADYATEYKFDTEFEREVKREVFKIVRRGREFGTIGWYFRACCYIASFFYLQYLWVTRGTSWQLAILYGLAQSLIGLNVQHDANHGAAAGKRGNIWINDLLGCGASLIGGDKWLWQEQHWTHHSFTNHASKDPDAFGAEPFFLFNDYPLGHESRKWIHKFQVLFYIPVLAGYWLSSVFNPEVLDLRQRGALGVGMRMDSDYLVSRRKYAVAFRLWYIMSNVVYPLVKQGFTAGTVGDILLMGVADSLGLAILFSLSHNFVHSDRDPTGSVTKTGEPVCWYKSQVETSCTYGGFLAGCLTGGLNFQVEHHLFPRMSSAWYPYIAPTVREICAKHNVRYVYYPWVWQNLWSTIKYMHAAGTGSNWSLPENPFSGKQ